jgi:hypothetical protein
MRLDHFRSRDYQRTVFKDNYDAESSKSFLSSSYFGGARYLKSNAQDALTIVSEVGAPTWFITVTVNAKWDVKFKYNNYIMSIFKSA